MRSAFDEGMSFVDRSPSFPTQGEWVILRTRSRREKCVASILASRGVNLYVPLARRNRAYALRLCQVEMPLFSQCVFVRVSEPYKSAFNLEGRVKQVIEVNEQKKLDYQLRNIEVAATKGAQLRSSPFVARGMLVKVCGGLFSGLEGVVDAASQRDRLSLQIDVLGQAVSMEVDAAQLKPISEGLGS